jgi:hypothetical protein
MSSQRSFQSIWGKFSDGVEVLKRIPGYNPSREEIKLTSLQLLKENVEAKNAAVVTTGIALSELRNKRRFISFRSEETDVNCIENLIRNAGSYIMAEAGQKNAVCDKINSILKKIEPANNKKETAAGGAEPGQNKSSSEKSYQSLVGFGSDVLTLITNMGSAYNPSNSNITVANFKAKVDELTELNSGIIKAGIRYSTAIKERNDVYKGEKGINKLVPLIKNYLASFEGGKKNADYAAFVHAVK